MEIKEENKELRDKIMRGVKKAAENLFANSAANNGKIVISDKDGKVKIVFAKDLILSLSN